MTFEKWFEKWCSERIDGPYKSINVESIARAAWEAAQAQEKGVASDTQQKLDKLTEHIANLEAEVALLNNAASLQPAMNNITSIEIKGLSHSIYESGRKTEIGELLINSAEDIGALTRLIDELAHQPAVQELDCNGFSLDLPEIGSEMDGDIVGAHVIQDGAVYVLLVAPPEAERELAWGNGDEDVHTSISDGYTNTCCLLSQLHKVGNSYPAANYCAQYGGGEYYLPSRLEFTQIAANKEAVRNAGLEGWYWTSTQDSANYARCVCASSGGWSSRSTTSEYAVRPIRKIKLTV